MLRDTVRLYLFAIRDSFITLLPLTFFRVLADLLRYLPVPGYHAAMADLFGPRWQAAVALAVEACLAAWGVGTAIAVAVFVHRRLSRRTADREPMQSIAVGFSALVNFMLYIFISGDSLADGFSYGAMPACILIGLGTGIILHAMSRWQISWSHYLTFDTDVVFFQAVRSCLPVTSAALATLVTLALAKEMSAWLPDPVLFFESILSSGIWSSTILASLINQITWFFGAHGTLVLSSVEGLLFAPLGEAYSSARGYRPLFDTFILLGGSGCTLGLLFSIMLSVREGGQVRVARLALIPSLFNINEVVLFGLPVVLNPLYLLPFIGVPLLATLISVGAIEAGMISFADTRVPWTTPPLISGWMVTGSWHGAALQCVLIGLSTFLYLPFVRMAERQRAARQSELVQKAASAIMEEKKRSPVIHRQDDTGVIARGLLGELKQAIARGDLELHYQPKLDGQETVVGFEALLRWTHRQHGPLSPILAVTLAEDGDMINELGAWVIDEACACKARLNALGYEELTMAFNISPMQLTDPDLPKRVSRALERNGLSPCEIELEVTESQAIPDNQQVDDAFRGLMEIGVRLAMDDFGMGYSSLLYLRRFEVGAIKIDGSLTRDVLVNEANADIIRSIAALGQKRGVAIVAEFVETIPQRDALIALGCSQFQGYLFSRPIPEADCVNFLRKA
ncbi:EAL domain-containing protein [Nisaea nitritireducens]|uniref:EAL domain-containing protein n=1 Tax=Nisaea nitritireducens TaxID=568392 RepID=UPI001868BFAE|nr:EAL domain-containing protein [Nisaea nitritireducens]